MDLGSPASREGHSPGGAEAPVVGTLGSKVRVGLALAGELRWAAAASCGTFLRPCSSSLATAGHAHPWGHECPQEQVRFLLDSVKVPLGATEQVSITSR